jgi:hypothetical protein
MGVPGSVELTGDAIRVPGPVELTGDAIGVASAVELSGDAIGVAGSADPADGDMAKISVGAKSSESKKVSVAFKISEDEQPNARRRAANMFDPPSQYG